MQNFVKIEWSFRLPSMAEDKRRCLLNDATLSWSAKGLGCYLTTTREGVRFPNTLWDGTMDALEELRRNGYLTVKQVEDAESVQARTQTR